MVGCGLMKVCTVSPRNSAHDTRVYQYIISWSGWFHMEKIVLVCLGSYIETSGIFLSSS